MTIFSIHFLKHTYSCPHTTNIGQFGQNKLVQISFSTITPLLKMYFIFFSSIFVTNCLIHLICLMIVLVASYIFPFVRGLGGVKAILLVILASVCYNASVVKNCSHMCHSPCPSSLPLIAQPTLCLHIHSPPLSFSPMPTHPNDITLLHYSPLPSSPTLIAHPSL